MPRDPQGWVLEKIISGGQTGVDQVALTVARELGYATGGVAPRGWRTDEGPAPWLAGYGLTEHKVSTEYGPRTRENVRLADATVLFDASALRSPGSRATQRFCQELGKSLLVNPSASELRDFIMENGWKILNIAGNRRRSFPQSAVSARIVLSSGLIPF